ncbi:OmpA family protein [Sphingomonas sp. LB-2]|uniref:OmpA family protein n=1 Tax=Sphingomonas caeni TaxID=2984949 RepID=UPI002230212C|nr:OmpA family protein [Sphingomonas caeni]MCW3846285.1 OmpA family protein [Sphingomonas caeni]
MNRYPPLIALTALTLLTSACVTDPNTGERRVSRAAIGGIGGALGGYLVGDIVGGRNDRTEKLIGAGIGGLAGVAVGSYMDRQEQDLRRRTAGTDIQVIRNGDELILRMPSSITFATDSAAIDPRYAPTLDQVAMVLRDYEQTYVDVYGHTDSRGSDDYNQSLSERRAASVADYLAARGVRSVRLGTRGFGETQPVASNETDAGRAANRRVEIKLVPIRRD